jgi:putative tryptophan/tyrosine transport system substrate-binding protein
MIVGAMGYSLAVRGEQAATPRVGFLNSTSPDVYAFNAEAFREGLRETGFVEGQNVAIDYRWAGGIYDRLPALAVELVERKVAVIAATGDIASALAAKKATAAIPIVFTVGSDPIRFGLVPRLSRPGGNATGITLFSSTLMEKRMQVLNELIRSAGPIALLMNPDNLNAAADQERAQAAARAFGRSTFVVNARGARDLETAFAEIREKRSAAVLLASDPTFLGLRNELVAAAARFEIPVVYWTGDFARAGGLLSYGSSITWMYRQAGVYCGRILKGARPADLPVLQPTTFELIVNLRTAKALGLTVPQSLLLRADEVIQ